VQQQQQQQQPPFPQEQQRPPHGVVMQQQQEHQQHEFQPNGINYNQDFGSYMPIPDNGSNRDPTNFQFLTDPFQE